MPLDNCQKNKNNGAAELLHRTQFFVFGLQFETEKSETSRNVPAGRLVRNDWNATALYFFNSLMIHKENQENLQIRRKTPHFLQP